MRRHEQGHLRLSNQGTQHDALDQNPHENHDGERNYKRSPHGNAAFVQAHEGQGSKEQLGALGEIEHAGGFVDEHEPQGDERVHDARKQAGNEDF